jgi:hypothetical protein
MLSPTYQLSGETGGYKAVMKFSQTSPVEGENLVEITITDANSRPVKGAPIKVEYLTPSVPGRKPMMYYATTAKPDGDVYRATLSIDMKGEWKAVLTIRKGQLKKTVTIPFEVK